MAQPGKARNKPTVKVLSQQVQELQAQLTALRHLVMDGFDFTIYAVMQETKIDRTKLEEKYREEYNAAREENKKKRKEDFEKALAKEETNKGE